MSQESKIFDKNLKEMIQTEWVDEMGYRPSTIPPEDIDEEAIAAQLKAEEEARLANLPPHHLIGTKAHMQ